MDIIQRPFYFSKVSLNSPSIYGIYFKMRLWKGKTIQIHKLERSLVTVFYELVKYILICFAHFCMLNARYDSVELYCNCICLSLTVCVMQCHCCSLTVAMTFERMRCNSMKNVIQIWIYIVCIQSKLLRVKLKWCQSSERWIICAFKNTSDDDDMCL